MICRPAFRLPLILAGAAYFVPLALAPALWGQAQHGPSTPDGAKVVEVAPAGADSAVAMSAKEFDNWTTATKGRGQAGPERSRLLEQAVVSRLKGDRYTSDYAVCVAVGDWVLYGDYPEVAQRKEPGQSRYKDAIRCIHELLPLLESLDGRAPLRGRLLALEGLLLRNDDLRSEAIKAYDAAIRATTPMGVAADQRIGECNVAMGELLELSGKLREADAAYFKAARCRWYLVEDPQASRELKGVHLKAMRGLIRCRQTDAGSLKDLRYLMVPADGREVKAELDEAIAAAPATQPSGPKP